MLGRLTPDQQAKVLDRMAKFTAPCYLCNGPQHSVAVFIPLTKEGQELARGNVPLAINKQRILMYALCERCGQLPNLADRVEDRIREMNRHLREGAGKMTIYDESTKPSVWPEHN